MRARLCTAISFLAIVGTFQVLGQQPTQNVIIGWITDTLCGAKGANAQHVECAKRAVASGKAKFALYDETRKKLYILEPQETAVAYLGQRVKVTGTLSFTSLQRAGESLDSKTNQVVTHAQALDSSTPIGGVLTISSVEVVPSPAATR